MEALGAAASAITLVELAVKVASLCLEYSSAVKNARPDIERLQQHTESLKTTAEGAQKLLQGPYGARLETSQNLHDALDNIHSQLGHIATRLERKLNGRRGKAMGFLGLRALKWPFESKDLESVIANLQRGQNTLSAALHIDETAEILDIHRKIDLSKLPVARGAAFDSQANEYDPRCHPGTRVDLLAEIYKWTEDPCGKCIFWLRGMAGTGKSTVSRTVASHLSEKNVPGASFFFKKGEGDRGKAAMFFTTVASQLVHQLPSLAPHVRNAIENEPAIADKTKKEQFERLILEPLDKCKDDLRTTPLIWVVIDALDECDREDDATGIIRLLSKAKELASVRLRFFVTSRPELPIRLGFKDIGGSYKDLALHEIPKPHIEKDISTFLSFRLAQIRDDFNKTVLTCPGLPLDWPCSRDLQSLVDMAVPLFIFASTACRFIADRDSGDPEEQLGKILDYQSAGGSSQLHTMYLPILNQLLLKRSDSGLISRAENERADILVWFREIVGSIVVLANPLTTASLARLLGKPQRNVDSKLDGLHSVLDIPRGPHTPVKLLHLSFRDFLVDPNNRNANPFWVDEREAHRRLAVRCLQLLSAGDTLKRDICGQRMPGTLRSEIDPRIINTCLPPEGQYACLYWVYHWKESKSVIRDGDQVHGFLRRHLLHWLEALGLLGRVSEGINMVDDLLALSDDPASSSDVSTFLRDTRRIILNSCSIIDASPLQAYSSAIVFAPDHSVVRKAFKDQFPGWISLLPKVQKDWDACLQTLEGHGGEVSSVKFSPDGSRLVSVSTDEAEQSREAKLWDTMTGECIATVESQSISAMPAALSPDGSWLASASGGKTIKLLDTASGDCTTTLQGHYGNVDSIMFSPDSSRLISISACWRGGPRAMHRVQLWDTTTGDCIVMVKSYVSRITFSPDSSWIASVSADNTIKLWDTATGDYVMMLQGHSGNVESIMFSPDGSQLASMSADKTIKLWDTATGDCATTLEGHSYEVELVTFSPDGKRLASSSLEKIIKLWDTTTGDCIRTLGAYSDNAKVVAFSPDSTRLVLALSTIQSWDRGKALRLWDTTTGARIAILEGHSSYIMSATFSPDGSRLASASLDMTIKLWDVAIGDCITTLKGHSDVILSVAFSLDGSRLASSSADKSIKLWDTARGDCTTALEDHNGDVNYIAFSPDRCRLASASNDKTIKLWSTATGDCLATLEGHSHNVMHIMFSPDGSRLVSTSHTTVKLWETVTGDCITTLEGQNELHLSFSSAPQLSPDGNWLALGSRGGTVKLYEIVRGDCITTLEGHSYAVAFISFSPDGSRLVSVSRDPLRFDSTIKLWDTATGGCITTFEGWNTSFLSVTFSPDSRRLVFTSPDSTIKLCDTSTGGYITTFESHGDKLTCHTFSPDSSRLASVSVAGNTIKVWDIATSGSIATLRANSRYALLAVFSPDGSRLASASIDKPIELWDIATSGCVMTLNVGPLPRRCSRRIAFDATGSYLHTAIGTVALNSSCPQMMTREPAPGSLSQTVNLQGVGLVEEGTWVTWDSNRVMWLPPAYRPGILAMTASILAIGCPSGRVVIMKFSPVG